MTTQRDYIIMIEQAYCANSTDGGGNPSNHRIDNTGACSICDRPIRALVILHGLDA